MTKLEKMLYDGFAYISFDDEYIDCRTEPETIMGKVGDEPAIEATL